MLAEERVEPKEVERERVCVCEKQREREREREREGRWKILEASLRSLIKPADQESKFSKPVSPDFIVVKIF